MPSRSRGGGGKDNARWWQGFGVQHLHYPNAILEQEKGVEIQHSPAAFALIEWILYGIHAWSVWIVSSLNQKKNQINLPL